MSVSENKRSIVCPGMYSAPSHGDPQRGSCLCAEMPRVQGIYPPETNREEADMAAFQRTSDFAGVVWGLSSLFGG